MSDDEVTYHYVKGQGWVARLGPEPQPVKPGWSFKHLDGLQGDDTFYQRMRDTFYQRMREHQEEAERRMWADAARQWVRRVPTQTVPYQRDAQPRQDTYTTTPAAWGNAPLYYVQDDVDDRVDGWTNLARGHGTRPAPANPEDIRETRYYPGANVAPEPVRAENQHERRAREYREELERSRRRRGR